MKSVFGRCLFLGAAVMVASCSAMSAETGNSIRKRCSDAGSQDEVHACVVKANKDSYSELRLQQAAVQKKLGAWAAPSEYLEKAQVEFPETMKRFADFRAKQCAAVEASAGGAAGFTHDNFKQACEAYLNIALSEELKRVGFGLPLKGYNETGADYAQQLVMSPYLRPCPDEALGFASTDRDAADLCSHRLSLDSGTDTMVAGDQLGRKLAGWDESKSTQDSVSSLFVDARYAYYEFAPSFAYFSGTLAGDFGKARAIAERLSRIRWHSVYTVQLREAASTLAQAK